MRITGQRPEFYRLSCDCGHAFQMPRPSMSAECPHCHAIGTTAELVTAYVVRNRKSVERMDREQGRLSA